VELTDGLRSLALTPDGAAWLDRLPALLAELAEQWNLELQPPYPGSNLAYVTRARHRGQTVVLKVQWPHRECEHEAAALAHWDGNGAVRLLAHDVDRHAFLVEHCAPGTSLATCEPSTALDTLVELLPRLWRPASAPFRPLAVEAAAWAAGLRDRWEAAGRPCEERLVDAALAYLCDLPASQGEQVLVHQDLHGDNVLAAEREPWLVIDPKPLAGEREFAVAPIVRSHELGHSRGATLGRLDRLCGELGLDRGRARGWTVAQTMAWSFDGPLAARHHDVARWLL
jgi:streptomycin 6-kinase